MRMGRHIPTSHRETTGERSRGARPLYGARVPCIPLVLTRDALNTRGSAGRTVPYLPLPYLEQWALVHESTMHSLLGGRKPGNADVRLLVYRR